MFGLQSAPHNKAGYVWLHAVSVGEVQVLRTIIDLLEKHRPDQPIAISVSTDAGIELARRLFAKHFVFRTPLDFSWSISTTLKTLKPKLIVLAELELWPNWLMLANRAKHPVAIVNGRLSQASYRGYARIPYLVRTCMQSIRWLGVQSETYAARFQSLGLPPERITVTGNVKFDGASGCRNLPEIVQRRQLLQLTDDDFVLVAGSTQSPEEAIVLRSFLDLHSRFLNLKLILVPRHPERFEEVAKLVVETRLPWARRSDSADQVSDANWKIFLGDSVGELRWWWGLAQLGFVGGSFGDRGGQNMIEPCAYGVATCFGPNTKNFADIVKLLTEANACVQLNSTSQLTPWLESMLRNPQQREQMSIAAASTCELHRGASRRTWECLERLLPPELATANPDATMGRP
ncbi:MAG: 3-deoxy-D-manno-octulosonic acid transferase [Pirellula sp.]